VPPALTGLQRDLLAWSETSRRDLPWRRTRDPWAILVSESMLQQTQVARVIPKYVEFLERMPTVAECAHAPAGDVVRLWAGLGYNRRALQLHATARVCVERHDGQIPWTLDGLLALPGVGSYTARAVLAFAWEADAGVVDTNAARVLARTHGQRLRAADAQTRADDFVPPGSAWAWNQAMLDLGATVCTKRSPRCSECPIEPHCAWRRQGNAAPDPAEGSAGTTRPQSAFAGSDREGRGRLVAALRGGPVAIADLAARAGWSGDAQRAERIAADLVREGLAALASDGQYRLPG